MHEKEINGDGWEKIVIVRCHSNELDQEWEPPLKIADYTRFQKTFRNEEMC